MVMLIITITINTILSIKSTTTNNTMQVDTILQQLVISSQMNKGKIQKLNLYPQLTRQEQKTKTRLLKIIRILIMVQEEDMAMIITNITRITIMDSQEQQ